MTLTADRIAEVLGERADVITWLASADAAARAAVGPELLDLCERRVAALLGQSVQPAVAENALQAACLAFVEHWVIDVASMPDELVAPLAEQLGDGGLMDLAHAILVVEQRLRLELAWQALGVGAA